MHTLREEAKKFFVQHETQLLQMYPGLTLNRLFQELGSFHLEGYLSSDEVLDHPYIEAMSDPFTCFFEKLKLGIPLAHISKQSYFYNSFFRITPDVLIPRYETEILVEMALKELKKYAESSASPVKVADVGVGSGCIIISIMKECDQKLECYGLDISESALDVCSHNFYHLRFGIHPDSSLALMKSDRLSHFHHKVHMIVSNPPYIPDDAKHMVGVHAQVHKFDPHLALYLKSEEYDLWFETFFRQVYNALEDHGVVLMEGHEDQIERQCAMLSSIGFKKSQVVKDLTGRDRFLKAYKN